MTGESIAEGQEPLDVVARHIVARAEKGDEHSISAAMLYRDLRRRIEAGEAGKGVKWFEWALQNIKLSESRLYELQTIGEASDPAAELERFRKLGRERTKKCREKKAAAEAALEVERQELMKWAKSAPIQQVRNIYLQVRRLPEAMPPSANAKPEFAAAA